jgi:hypothetical protein
VSAVLVVVLECLTAVYDPEIVDELDVPWLAMNGDRVFEGDEVDCVQGFGLGGGEGRDVGGAGC